jgi:hypothetical protein
MAYNRIFLSDGQEPVSQKSFCHYVAIHAKAHAWQVRKTAG